MHSAGRVQALAAGHGLDVEDSPDLLLPRRATKRREEIHTHTLTPLLVLLVGAPHPCGPKEAPPRPLRRNQT
ncbi:MAG TPA: hypothetical protein DEP35_06945 [Deltaproteobacteria bacterium]|nr:hypothetical protein [Deltaproteobacteria bacterium]